MQNSCSSMWGLLARDIYMCSVKGNKSKLWKKLNIFPHRVLHLLSA